MFLIFPIDPIDPIVSLATCYGAEMCRIRSRSEADMSRNIAFDCASLRGLQGQDFAGWKHLSNQRIASAWNQLGESACYAGEG
jgi:hypothetical protein